VEAGAKLSCKAAFLDIRPNANGVSDFDTLRSAIHKAPYRIVLFVDLLHLAGQDLRRSPLIDGSPQEADRAESAVPDPVQRSCRL